MRARATRSKYIPGAEIRSLDVLMEQEVVWVTSWNKAMTIAFLQNWSAHLLSQFMRAGSFRKAIRKDGRSNQRKRSSGKSQRSNASKIDAGMRSIIFAEWKLWRLNTL